MKAKSFYMSIYMSITLSLVILLGFSLIAVADCMLWLSFDEGKGEEAMDKSNAGNNCKVMGAKWVTGKVGKALEFNGTSDYVLGPTSPTLAIAGDITIMAWIKPNAFSGGIVGYGSFDDGAGPNVPWALDISGNMVQISFENPNTFLRGGKVTIGEFRHIAVTRVGGGEVKFYTDGELIDTVPNTAIPDSPGGNILYIGVYVSGKPDFAQATRKFYSGVIDEIEVYNEVLTQNQIQMKVTMAAVSPSDSLSTTWGQVRDKY